MGRAVSRRSCRRLESYRTQKHRLSLRHRARCTGTQYRVRRTCQCERWIEHAQCTPDVSLVLCLRFAGQLIFDADDSADTAVLRLFERSGGGRPSLEPTAASKDRNPNTAKLAVSPSLQSRRLFL